MNERFEILAKFKNNLYAQGSPVVISAGALLKDKKTDSVITQLKFQSVSNKKIIALKITLSAFDVSGNPVEKVNEYQYLDLSIYNGSFFGFDKAIVMPDKVTRSVKIEKITVVFDSGICELLGEKFSPFETQEKLATILSPDLIKQYQIDAGTQGEYIPQSVGELWLCACQTPNTTSNCALCGANKISVFNACDPAKLDTNLQLRLAQQQELAEKKRKQNEETQAALQAEKKKKKTLFVIIGAAVAFILISIVTINALVDKMHYNRVVSEIETLIQAGQYEQAFDVINSGNLSYDDKDTYRDKVIPYMQEQHEEIRDSGKENLVYYDADTEYYVSKYEIYSVQNGKTNVLYEASESGEILGIYEYNYLSSDWCLYANGYLFFIECCEWRETGSLDEDYVYAAKYVNIDTGEVETIAKKDGYANIYAIMKLYNGSIYFGLDWWHEKDGIIFNPYTQDMYEGEDVIYDSQLESAIYRN